MKQQATLRNWGIEDRGEYYALRGQVYGHDRFTDGEWVKTSCLLHIDFEKGEAETKNTIYILLP